MGAEVGKPVSNLGITAIASVTPGIEQKELTTLKNELVKTASSKGSDLIVKSELDDALKKSGKFDAADLDIFAKLFILFDSGDETVNYKDYLAGLSGCILSLQLTERLKFVFSIFDTESAKMVTRSDLKRSIVSINSVASYFGDPVLTLSDLDQVTQESFEALTGGTSKVMPVDTLVEFLLKHPLVQVFLLGEGKVRFGAAELNPPAV